MIWKFGSFGLNDEVAVGCLIDLELNGKTQKYFLSGASGGSLLVVQGTPVMVISVFSPIGDAVLGLKVGEEFELETPQEVREYFVKSIF